MRSGFKKLLLGLALIGATSTVLLLSDANRRSAKPNDIFRVAVLQLVSSPLMEDGVSGMRSGLTESGLLEGQDVEIQIYKSEGDIPTANTIAAELVSGRFDSCSLPGLRRCKRWPMPIETARRSTCSVWWLTPSVQGWVSSGTIPSITRRTSSGIGSLIPMAPGIELARELYPDLKAIGLVWNPAESNSEILTLEARRLCSETGIELLEANRRQLGGRV